MKKILTVLSAAFLAAVAHADPLKFISVDYPNIYCRFSGDCSVSPTEQSVSVTTTNGAASCVLTSRSFPGTTMNSTGQYGYEYQLTLNNNNNSDYQNKNHVPGGAFNQPVTNLVTINTLTLKFDQPQPFPLGHRASNQVWVVNGQSTVSPGLAPDSADSSGKKVTFSFDPPLILNVLTDQTTNTCFFGLVSATPPEISNAILAGSTQDPINGTAPVVIKLQAQMP